MRKMLCVVISFILILCISTGEASSMSEKYDQALELFMQEKYNEAATILDEIRIYNDSSQLSLYCKSIQAGQHTSEQEKQKIKEMPPLLMDYTNQSTYFLTLPKEWHL